jgi:hypothetical protein
MQFLSHKKREMDAVSVRVCISAQNIMTKKQGGEERLYSAYTSTLLFITKGSQDRNSHRAGTWRQEGRCLLACSACFLIEPGTNSPGMAPPTTGPPRLGHLDFLVEKNQSHEGISSREAPFFCDNCSLCQVDRRNQAVQMQMF